MIQEDYFVKLFAQFAQGVRAAINRAHGKHDPLDSTLMLETLIGQAAHFDSKLLLSLDPKSFVDLLQTTAFDPALAEFVARSLLLEAEYLSSADKLEEARLRKEQAYALVQEYSQQVSNETLTEDNPELGIMSYLDSSCS